MTTYEMKNTLDGYPADALLQVGLPDIKFYAEGNQLQALCPFHEDHKLGNFGFNLSAPVCTPLLWIKTAGPSPKPFATYMTTGAVPFPALRKRLLSPFGKRE